MAPQCQALHLSDESRCTEAASQANDLFCPFHARQAYGLYKGYKRRNIQLDRLIAQPPAPLENKALSNLDFSDIEDEPVLKEVHDHLLQRHALLERVIRARKLHHSRFYALDLDYGHQKYLDHLASQKHITIRALERLERRAAELQFHKERWFRWITELEDKEEVEREAEKKKMKQEAALFKRHYKEVEARMRALRRREEEQQQQDFLHKAWQDRLASSSGEDSSAEEADPIEDVIADKRGNYLDLIRHFLWLEPVTATDPPTRPPDHSDCIVNAAKSLSLEEATPTVEAEIKTEKPKKKKGKPKGKPKAEQPKTQNDPVPGEHHVETSKELRSRLMEGEKLGDGAHILQRGTISKPLEVTDRTAPLEEVEVDSLLGQIAEIKQLLFCRLILAHPTLLSVALKAPSIEAFLASELPLAVDLRDLCLKMEQPSLQEVRDACADLHREEADFEDKDDEVCAPAPRLRKFQPQPLSRRVPRSFQTEREKRLKDRRERVMPDDVEAVDFGDIDDQDQYRFKNIRVRVCGRYIYNYPSEKAMSRGGWLQFCVMAKACSFPRAVSLCRNWEEFFELSILASYYYFPASNWIKFNSDKISQQLVYLGFFPYFRMSMAEQGTTHSQTGSRQRGALRRHSVTEVRNFMCAHIKRNDAVSRRFIQYAAMETSAVVVFVRDVKTGNVLVQPPDDELWLVRQKAGAGRASRNAWTVLKRVGPEFQEEIDHIREWHLGFKDFYDIVIWDVEPGQNFAYLYNTVQTLLMKAHRFQTGLDLYRPTEHILKTIYFERGNSRSKDVTLGHEGQQSSIWDDLHAPGTRFEYRGVRVSGGTSQELTADDCPLEWKYTEADRLEDRVLFPWEESGQLVGPMNEPVEEEPVLASRKANFENATPDLERFIHDLDTDEELGDVASHCPKKCSRNSNQSFDSTDYSSPEENELSEEDRDMINAIKDWAEVSDQEPEGSFFRKQETMPGRSGPSRALQTSGFTQVDEDFMLFMDRERASYFKEIWHKSDLEPGAVERWIEYKRLMASYQQWYADVDNKIKAATFVIRMLTRMGHGNETHHRVVRDMRQGNLLASLFFGDRLGFLKSDTGSAFQNSLLFDPQSRSNVPDIRSHHSNKTRPTEQWREWDALSPAHVGQGIVVADYPAEWSMTIRPTVAALYKGGVICPAYGEGVSGPTVCLTEPGRERKPDLYFDWRRLTAGTQIPSTMQDPTKIKPLIAQAQTLASGLGRQARFTVLRIWSAPHFWPLMLGIDGRFSTSFCDPAGRWWEWKFIPKDMPYSEWSIHQTVRMRIEPYRSYFGDKVTCRRDAVLIAGRDEEECRELTVGTLFALQTRPWRLEVDPWKSWWNVDLEFLQGLDHKWWV